MLKIEKYLAEKKALINKRLLELIFFEDCIQKEIFEAANYALHPKGKRFRPILLLATVETLEKDPKKALDIACAIEMIHTYSLIHDDLPSMDNSSLRRGKPSLHKKFSPATAILTGDFLLTYAFEVISKANITCKEKIKVIESIAKHSAGFGLIGGQYIDLNKEIDKKNLYKMHEYKTASLFIAATECGAILSNATKKEFSALCNFAKKIGIAFQIVDDILDAVSDEKILGKPVKKDKKNTVSLLGIREAKKEAIRLYDEGVLHLAALPFPPPLLKDFAYKLVIRNF